MQVIGKMRQLRKKTLQNWADNRAKKISRNMQTQKKDARKHIKKTLVAHHLY
jgi:hypothetical protein